MPAQVNAMQRRGWVFMEWFLGWDFSAVL